jgi:hypothetical protein
MLSEASGRASAEEVKRKALSAIICFYHPDADHSKLSTKVAWANEWGVERQRFNYYEKIAQADGAIDTYRRGMVPLPTRLTEEGAMKSYAKPVVNSDDEEEVEALVVHGVEIEELLTDLKSRCTRAGDDVPFAQHGPTGLFREAVKWGVQQMNLGKLSGRHTSQVLKRIGVRASSSMLWKHASEVEEGGEAASPSRRGRRNNLPPRALGALKKWAVALRAMSLRVSRSLVLGHVNALIVGTAVAEAFKHKHAKKSWYYSWINAAENADLGPAGNE